MKNLFKLLIVALIFTSCEDVEPVIYNGSENENVTFLSFDKTAYNLPIVRDGDGNVAITLNTSTVSNVDRVYNLEIIDTDQLTTADPATYNFPATITIPAGAYQGTAVIEGEDINVDQAIETIVFRISNIDGESMDNNQITVNLFEVCPLEDDFTGQYVVTQVTNPVTTTSGTPIYLFGQNITVNVVAVSEYERSFETRVWPALFTSAPPVTFNFSLSCERVLTSSVEAQGFCSWQDAEETIPNYFSVGEAENGGFYTNTNDSVITITVEEDATASCLSAGRNVTFTLTKVN